MLNRVRGTLGAMTISPQEIQDKEFREAFRGYNEDDVDVFLDEVVEAYASVYQDNQRMKIQLASLQQEVARLAKSPGSAPAPPVRGSDAGARQEAHEEIRRQLAATQQASEAALEEAKRRAAEIVARAEGRAKEVDDLTRRRAKEIDVDAGAALSDAQRRVDDLRSQEAELRDWLRRILAEHIRVLQTLESDLPPATEQKGQKIRLPERQSPVVERMTQELQVGQEPVATPPAPGGEFWRK